LRLGPPSPELSANVISLRMKASAALRNASHSDELRITIWYPAAAQAVEAPLDVGPPGKPFFTPGSAAPNADFEDARPRPVILLSHGFGGSARIMAWFGTALARQGYVVIAVDHPGNNGRDPMTIGGAVLSWERPGDLKTALDKAKTDPTIGTHLDLNRLGAAGFSAGGFTSLVEAGARVDPLRFQRFCAAHPDDGICAPQREFQFSRADAEAFFAQPAGAVELAHVKDDLRIANVKAAFVMAPASSRASIRIVSRASELRSRSFWAAGDAVVPVCPTEVPRAATHKAAIDGALALFGATLGGD
jgi:predicted dienelactone hydrolase